MGIFYRATITPTKHELIEAWLPTRPWGPAEGVSIEPVGAFRFDDPDNRVGMETHLVEADGVVLQVPLCYREEPVDGAEDAFIDRMEHSELGTRFVYDGLGDERFVLMLAAVTMTGQGEALGMVEADGRWYIAPASVRIQGGGWGLERVAVDGFAVEPDDGDVVVFGNDRFRMRFFRRPVAGPRPAIGLTATWDQQTDPVVLADVTER